MIALPAPVALARLTDLLIPAGVRQPVWEPKWDGFRCLAAGGRLWSRHGTDLTRFFPDLAPVLAARLPADLVLDGELIAWNTAAGRLDFAGLQSRLTAGARLRASADRRPAQLVAFDVLASDGVDLRPEPLRTRRAVLEQALSGLSSPIVLCQQSGDPAVAQQWFSTLTAGGIEGLVIKEANGLYPTREGQRPWWKYKAKTTLDMVAVGFTGTIAAPATLVLAFPHDVRNAAGGGDGVSAAGEHVPVAGATTNLTKAAARVLAPMLCPTGATFQRRFAWTVDAASTVTVIDPLVVEVSADASVETGVLRHAARFLRARPDLQLSDVD